MKSKLSRILLLLLFQVISNKLLAYSFTNGGIYYNILSSSSKTVSVTYKSTSLNSYTGQVVIPMNVTYNGAEYTVAAIGERAFLDCNTLTKVTIPSSITTIEDNAFYYCSALEAIDLPISVSSIGESAFYGCTNLKNITIPSNCKSIGENAFRYCKNITSFFIPKNVKSIGNSAFGDCFGISSFVVEEGNENYDSRDNCNALIESKTNKLILGTKNTVIPNSVTQIGEMSFYNMISLEAIEIPSSIITIGYMAFSGCKYLKTVKMSNSVTEIGYDVFSGCTRLSSIELSNKITTIPKNAFYGCKSLKNITISNGVRKIGQSAFWECSSLVKIDIPASVYIISDYSFYKCTSLSDLFLYTKGDPLDVSWNIFGGVDINNITLHVRQGKKEVYQDEDVWVWSSFENIVEMPSLIGDVNDDGFVDTMDVKELENIIMTWNISASDDSFSSYDINNDGKINVTDISKLIDILRK